MGHSAFDRRSFFVVIPGCDQHIRHRVIGIIVFREHAQCVAQGFSAALIDVPIQAPGRFGVVESRPDCAHGDLVATLRHLAVEVFQVFLTPFATVGGPSLGTGMHPGVLAVEGLGELLRGIVLVQKNRWLIPLIHYFPNAIPIGVSSFWKNENDWPSLVSQVDVAAGCIRSDIGFIRSRKRIQGVLGCVTVIFLGFVVHQGKVEMLPAGNLLHERVCAVQKRVSRAVPVDRKRVDAHLLRLLDLPADYGGVVAVVIDSDMVWVAEPGLKCGNQFRGVVALRDFVERRFAFSVVAPVRYEAGSQNRA